MNLLVVEVVISISLSFSVVTVLRRSFTRNRENHRASFLFSTEKIQNLCPSDPFILFLLFNLLLEYLQLTRVQPFQQHYNNNNGTMTILHLLLVLLIRFILPISAFAQQQTSSTSSPQTTFVSIITRRHRQRYGGQHQHHYRKRYYDTLNRPTDGVWRLQDTATTTNDNNLEDDGSNNKNTNKQGGGGSASIPNLTISLVKSLVGAGVLALPSSIALLAGTTAAAAATTGWQLLPASIIILVIGLINAYFFSLIGRVCSMTGATSYQDAWDRTIGRERDQHQAEEKDVTSTKSATPTTTAGPSIVATVITLKTILSCLAFSIILADSFQSLALAFGLENATRGQALITVSTFILLPLCTF